MKKAVEFTCTEWHLSVRWAFACIPASVWFPGGQQAKSPGLACHWLSAPITADYQRGSFNLLQASCVQARKTVGGWGEWDIAFGEGTNLEGQPPASPNIHTKPTASYISTLAFAEDA